MNRKLMAVALVTVLISMVLGSSIACSPGEQIPEEEEYLEVDLIIYSTEGGSCTTPGEGIFTYHEGDVVDLVATPDPGYRFVNWIGDVETVADVNAANTTITIPYVSAATIMGMTTRATIEIVISFAPQLILKGGVVYVGDKARITFDGSFESTPVVVTMAQSGGFPLISSAYDTSTTGFNLHIIDHDGYVDAGWVQWIAVGPQAGTFPVLAVQSEVALHGHQDHITFDPAFDYDPVILTMAQYQWNPHMSCAVNNDATGFDLALADHNGNTVSTAWVQTIAVNPGIPPSDLMIQAKECWGADGQSITFDTPFATIPAIVTNARTGEGPDHAPLISCAVNNAATGFDLALTYWDGVPVAAATVQYIAIGPAP